MMWKQFFSLVTATLLTSLHGGVLYQNTFSSEEALEGWTTRPGVSCSEGVLNFKLDRKSGGFPSIVLPLDPEKAAGKLIELSAEVKARNLKRYDRKPFTGVKIQLLATGGGKKVYLGTTGTKEGSYDWETLRQVVAMPSEMETLKLQLGMQGATGEFQMRNLTIRDLGTPLPLQKVADMAFQDKKAGDGTGGWSDQGPQNDGSPFLTEFWRKEYRGIPFSVRKNGKAVLTMASEHFPSGPQEIAIPLDRPATGKYLYLLHTLCWGDPKQKKAVGQLEVIGEKGREKLSVTSGVHVGDWWSPARLSNGIPALTVRVPGRGSRTLYATRLELKRDLGKITALRFLSAKAEAVWIVCAATLSDKKIDYPKEKPSLEIKPGKEWMTLWRNGSLPF